VDRKGLAKLTRFVGESTQPKALKLKYSQMVAPVARQK